jgi:hypothetical protein
MRPLVADLVDVGRARGDDRPTPLHDLAGSTNLPGVGATAAYLPRRARRDRHGGTAEGGGR